MDDETMKRAHIFISAGQRTVEESEIVRRIEEKVKEMQFLSYVAISTQSTKSIRDNIFSNLEDAEYFIFIDFKREKLVNGEFRGSLFAHLELAIATYLDKEIIAFREIGVKKDDGLIGSIQGNAIPFSDREHLPTIVASQVKEKWDCYWRNKIAIDRDPDEMILTENEMTGEKVKWFHLNIKNLHKKKIAFDCMVYLNNITKLDKNYKAGKPRFLPPVELKWRNLKYSRITISQQNEREVDVFYISLSSPEKIFFGINREFVDDPNMIKQNYILNGTGKYELEFVVFSVGFG